MEKKRKKGKKKEKREDCINYRAGSKGPTSGGF